LFQNERGLVLFGRKWFSAAALGGLDAPPWTNAFGGASLTDPKNTQVPDPSWRWAHAEWKVYEGMGGDEGWEYAFCFSRRISWHPPRWYNSFVRRRAWVRGRVKMEGHPRDRRFSVSNTSGSTAVHSGSSGPVNDLAALLARLPRCRIDREKLDLVKEFLEGPDIAGLPENMTAIMDIFMFDNSRRLLVTHLVHMLAKTTDPARREILDAAGRAGDNEVRKVAYWSDVRDMEHGTVERAHTHCTGWQAQYVPDSAI
jgi:hypothetical protein